MRGALPKQVEELKMSGGFRPDRHNGRMPTIATDTQVELPDEVKGVQSTLEDNYTDDEIFCWRKVVEAAEDIGGIAFADAEVAWQLAQSIYRHRLAAKAIREHGVVVTAPTGALKRNPACAVADTECKNIARLSEALGLTPAGRARLNIRSPKR